MKKNFAWILFSLVLIASLAACNLPLFGQSGGTDESAISTQVALTVQAAQSGNVVYITATPAAQVLPTVTAQSLATQSLPTVAQPSVTPTTDACNRASFVTDVTIPDGASIIAGSTFVKTWRVKNVGTCTWNTSYALVTFNGDDLGAAAVTPLAASVPPGGTIDLSINLKAPTTDGNYQQNFKLRSDTGLLFATGTSFSYPLYVKISVIHVYAFTLMPTLDFSHIPLIPLEINVYNFASNYCDASWINHDLTHLPCPGTTSDATGFVVRNDSPFLQNGTQYNGPTLFTHPQWIDNGTIAGFFPAKAIQNGYRFRAILGCAQGGNACNVIAQLNYSLDGGPTQSLQMWTVKYSDAPITVDIDLSSLAGHNVAFVLAVSTNGSSGQDWMQWVNPRIIK